MGEIRPLTPYGYVLLTEEEHTRLVESASLDDMLVICEVCGAWLHRDDPACAAVDDFHGCWKMATDDPRYANECRSHRAPASMGRSSTAEADHGK